jgi:hypothetical protein
MTSGRLAYSGPPKDSRGTPTESCEQIPCNFISLAVDRLELSVACIFSLEPAN